MATQRRFTRHGRSRISFGSRARGACARVCNETWTASRLYAFRYIYILFKKNFFFPRYVLRTHTGLSVAVTRPGTLPDHNLTASSSRARCPARSVKFPVGKKQISKNPRSVHLLFKSHSRRQPTHAYPAPPCTRSTVSFARTFVCVCVFDTPFFFYIYIISAKNYRPPHVLALGGAAYVVGVTGKMYAAVVLSRVNGKIAQSAARVSRLYCRKSRRLSYAATNKIIHKDRSTVLTVYVLMRGARWCVGRRRGCCTRGGGDRRKCNAVFLSGSSRFSEK